MGHVVKFWIAMAQLNLKPIATEVAVGCYQLRIGTRVDVQCLDANGNNVIIENKTGFNGYYDQFGSHRMHHPYDLQTDSPHNQHQLQLLMTVELFQRTFTHLTVVKAFVIRYHNQGSSIYPLENWCTHGRNALLQLTQQNINQPKTSSSHISK